jgi:hypothetical protein
MGSMRLQGSAEDTPLKTLTEHAEESGGSDHDRKRKTLAAIKISAI